MLLTLLFFPISLKKLFRGPTLYMSAYDKRFATFSPGMMSNGEMWKAVLGGRFFILECPGDHHSMIREPTNAKNMGHAIIAAATLSLRKLRPYKVREQVTFIKRTKLMLLKQQGLTVGAFQWKEGKNSNLRQSELFQCIVIKSLIDSSNVCAFLPYPEGTPILWRIWMCGRDFQTLTLCRPKFRQNFGPFADKWLYSFENIYPKTQENEFLTVYPCIIENKL